MKFIADLHIHSRFSMATSKNLDLEHLYQAAQLKGITVVATGDVTHPGWIAEISEKLVAAEPGLYRLKDELAAVCDQHVPESCLRPVRFALVSEISNIYKKGGRTRKNHNLVFLPDLDAARRFNARLDQIGNIRSDGRPILGLDARNLLEILLNTDDRGFLVPAHIWTPWFSLFGSKSGFDSIYECFEDLTSYIFAVETGLSSDPAMNWRVGQLDGLTLISNSDAHSPMNLGREANLFDTQLSLPAIRSALQSGDSKTFLGTFEFFPEEGKYHADGHRKCGVCFTPPQTMAAGEICPVCEKPLTVGVLYRVSQLAQRPEGYRPVDRPPYFSLIPLREILAEVYQVGSNSKKVLGHYQGLLSRLGPEFDILHHLPLERIETAGQPLLAEAIDRVRKQRVLIAPGYDGDYGTIHIFQPGERRALLGQQSLFLMPENPKKGNNSKSFPQAHETGVLKRNLDAGFSANLNSAQQTAVDYGRGPLIIIAGPGTGKTHTLACRIARLISSCQALPQQVLAVTFTNKAAQQMRERIAVLLAKPATLPLVATFHGLCFAWLKEMSSNPPSGIVDDANQLAILKEVILKSAPVSAAPEVLLSGIARAKQHLLGIEDDLTQVAGSLDKASFRQVYAAYEQFLSELNLCDFEDLIFKVVTLLEGDSIRRETYRKRFPYLFVDEYQDLNYGQYRLVKALAPPDADICVIGDPDQAIYGFRGSDPRYFQSFFNDYPQAGCIQLKQNYRSVQTILDAAYQMISAGESVRAPLSAVKSGSAPIELMVSDTEHDEAEAIAKAVEILVGGTGYHDIDTGKVSGLPDNPMSFSDIAVLFRTRDQARLIEETFQRRGIPCQIAGKQDFFDGPGIRERISWLKLSESMATYEDIEMVWPLLAGGKIPLRLNRIFQWAAVRGLAAHALLTDGVLAHGLDLDESSRRELERAIAAMADLVKACQLKQVEEKLALLGNRIPKKKSAAQKEAEMRLMESARAFGTDTSGFLHFVSMQTDVDILQSGVEKVALMTMHAAKGLEFSVVFVAGCEHERIPFRRRPDAPIDKDEERRLFFVAMTRAKDRLFLSRAAQHTRPKNVQVQQESPFIRHIDDSLKTSYTNFRVKRRQEQLSLF